MAVSGSTNFSLNRDELILDALTLIGVRQMDESIQNSDLQLASRTLNMMLKAWQADGLQLWLKRDVSGTLVASQANYSMGPSGADITVGRPLGMVEVLLQDTDSNDTPLNMLTSNEYKELSNKTTTGTPNSYYYDPQLTSGVLYIWPAPDATAATEYTLEITYQKPVDDMDAATDDFEFPQEWLEVVKYGLAIRLAPMYGLPIEDRRQLYFEYKPMKDSLTSWDQEDGSVYLQHDRTM